MGRARAIAALSALLCGVAACAPAPQRPFAIPPWPVETGAAVVGAGAVALGVQDWRPARTINHGDYAEPPIETVVGRALRTALRQRGFEPGDGAAAAPRLTVGVLEVAVHYHAGLLVPYEQYEARVRLSAVCDAPGARHYVHAYERREWGSATFLLLPATSTTEPLVARTLAHAVGELVDDPGMAQCLAGPAPP
ncbi:MAG: hypothetical protein JSR54_20490 [Proteobacteria bacterium]|nr:hypothetical protein [Pseudomonadota bacterium]